MIRATFILLCLTFISGFSVNAQSLVGHWTFESGEEVVDRSGNFDTLRLRGAPVKDGFLQCRSDARAIAGAYTGPNLGRNKTLVIWLKLDDLRGDGGFPMILYKRGFTHFDGIGFDDAGIADSGWYVGSDMWERSRFVMEPGFIETETGKLIQLALVHRAHAEDSIWVSFYRNGELIADYGCLKSKPYYTGSTEVHFGTDNEQYTLKCSIEEARIYKGALSRDEIMNLQPVQGKSTFRNWLIAVIVLIIIVTGFLFFRYRKRSESGIE